MNFESNPKESSKLKTYEESVADNDLNKDHFDLINDIESPKDILKYPKKERGMVLEIYKEKLLKEKLEVSEFKARLDEYIQKKFNEDGISLKDIVGFIKNNLKPDFIKKNLQELKFILKTFDEKLEKINFLRDVSKEKGNKAAFNACSMISIAENLNDDFEIVFSPYSVSFIFEDRDDMYKFVSKNQEELENLRKRDVTGNSYYRDGIPINAILKDEETDVVLKHEDQHKKFNTINVRNFNERIELIRIRNEIFARLAEDRGYDPEVLYSVLINGTNYNTWDKEEDEYYKNTIKEGLETLNHLKRNYDFSNDDLINLLSDEPIKNWNRFLNQMDDSMVV